VAGYGQLQGMVLSPLALLVVKECATEENVTWHVKEMVLLMVLQPQSHCLCSQMGVAVPSGMLDVGVTFGMLRVVQGPS
jgi:hypothetical protein